MKRIAALAALVVTMLAVPAAALADTGAGPGGSGPGYGRPGPVQVACQLPGGFRKGPVKLQAYARAYRIHHRKPFPIRIVCPKPYPKACEPQRLVFGMAAGSGTVTEVSGPVLSPEQEFSYGGGSYTITSVNPGGGSFTVSRDGGLFVNQGTAITDGVGWLSCPA